MPLPAGQSRDFLLAHELAAWVLGHAYRPAPDEATTSRWQRQQERCELDANAEAVKTRRFGVPAGPPADPGAEISDLIRRYPACAHIGDSGPSWPEPRWADHAASRDARSSAPLDRR